MTNRAYFIKAVACFILMITENVGTAQINRRTYLKDRLHDQTRDKPVRVIPGDQRKGFGPSDAIVLFDGSNTDAWEGGFKLQDSLLVADKGGFTSKRHFRDIQLHLEWRINDTINANGQSGANSGVYIMGKYEIQILENFVNTTYADGQAGAIYGQYPPLVNASTPQGNWNVYDIIFKAPVYTDGKLVEKATVTVLHNGVLVQNNQPYEGPTVYKQVASYPVNHPEKGPIHLQFHGDPVQYRNIWVRELNGPQTTKRTHWNRLFEQGKLGIDFTINAGKHVNDDELFKITGKGIEVLYNWKDREAPFAMISTNKEYSHYNLELEYKWGNRKFAPRLEAKRDAGILFHIYREKEVWPSSLECQIQEEDTGDLWVIKGPKLKVKKGNGEELVIDSKEKDSPRNIRYANYEIEGWNAVRIEVRGAQSAKFYINGHLVNEMSELRDDRGNLLSKGSIGLQAEGAEISYRNVRIEELPGE